MTRSRNRLTVAWEIFSLWLLLWGFGAMVFAESSDPFKVPDDFQVQAAFGGRAPWTTRGILQFSADGKAYGRMYKSDGSKVLHEEKFTLRRDQIASLHCAVIQSGFFLLPKKHDGSAADGSFCSIQIKGGGRSATVDTANISVPQLDKLCRFINTLVPEKCEIFYNQIVDSKPAFTRAFHFLPEGLPAEDQQARGKDFMNAVSRNLKEIGATGYYPFPNGMQGEVYRFHKWGDVRGGVPAVLSALLAPARIRFHLAAPAELQEKHLRKPEEAGEKAVPGMAPRGGLVPLNPPAGFGWRVSPKGTYLLVAIWGSPGFNEGIVEKAEPTAGPGALKVKIREASSEPFGRWLKANPGHRLALSLEGKILAVVDPARSSLESVEFTAPSWTGLVVNRLLEVFKTGLAAPGLYREVNGTWGYIPDLDLFIRNRVFSDFPPLPYESVERLKARVSAVLDPLPVLWFAEVRKGVLTIYGEPDRSAGRLRSGRAVRYGIGTKEKAVVSRTFHVLKKNAVGVPRIPMGMELPFACVGEIPDAELVAIVDSLRTGPGKTFGEGKDAVKVTVDTSQPLLAVEKKEDRVVVKTGVEYSPKLGAGQVLTLRKTDAGYVLADLRWWWKS
ncbi:MAG: hypothetical protein ACYTHM_09270 [Planctomycetota bacterium]|jgi:hypothetical protein